LLSRNGVLHEPTPGQKSPRYVSQDREPPGAL
jgi:hypothetical protein